MKDIIKSSGLFFFFFFITSCEKDKKVETPINFKITTGTVQDIESNVYKTITFWERTDKNSKELFETYTWMAENLKTTKYNDGTSIPLITDNVEWGNMKTPAYCWYNNDATTYKVEYGALYNWFTVDTKKLCPKGWHVSTPSDWSAMINMLGGPGLTHYVPYNGGGILEIPDFDHKLKETGTAHWIHDDKNVTNESSFTALPGGEREVNLSFPERNGKFQNIGSWGYWWAGEHQRYYIQSSALNYEDGKNAWSGYGLSIRCVLD